MIAIIKLAVGISEQYITKYTLTTESNKTLKSIFYRIKNIIIFITDNIFTVVFECSTEYKCKEV